MRKVQVGIIGTGNIGTDLLMKIQRSEFLECGIFAGRNLDSEGIRIANKMGVITSSKSIDYIVENPDCCDIVFDATSSKTHEYHAPILDKLNKYVVDLTPAHIGPFCIPVVNLEQALTVKNVNMVTCGGQATIPIADALTRAECDIKYLEIVATIASKSAGPGTRANIDEFTQTTSDALKRITGVNNTKAIIVLNPAEPPIQMQNTLYAQIEKADEERIVKEIKIAEKKVQEYVPGYSVIFGPNFENGRVTVGIRVIGSGDYLPKYAGNLDIITCAAIKVAEEYAKHKLLEADK